jgi:hypothetical protein
VWYDWEEKQEYAPLITGEDERSGWVNFPGAVGRGSGGGGGSSSSSDGEGSDDNDDRYGSSSPVKPAFPLHEALDAFTFHQRPPAAAGAGAGAGAGAAGAGAPTITITVDPTDPILHGDLLQVPPGERPRGKDRRIVRRADSLPAIQNQQQQQQQAEKDAAAREFLDASFDPVKALLTIQQSTADAPPNNNSKNNNSDSVHSLHNKKRGSISMKGLKKMIFRKKSTSA